MSGRGMCCGPLDARVRKSPQKKNGSRLGIGRVNMEELALQDRLMGGEEDEGSVCASLCAFLVSHVLCVRA